MAIKFENKSCNLHRVRNYIGDAINENWILEDIRKKPKNKNSRWNMYGKPDYSFKIKHIKTNLISSTLYIQKNQDGIYRVSTNNGQSAVLETKSDNILKIIKEVVKSRRHIAVAYETRNSAEIDKFGNIF